MRASRVARETSKYFDATSTTPVLPRRSTRASLARFAHNVANGDHPDNADAEVKLGSDIEDAVTSTATRKRKRTATIVTTQLPRRASTRARKTEVKTEAAVVKTEAAVVKSEETAVKTEPDSDAEAEVLTPKPAPRGRARKPARKTTNATTGETTIEPPSDWEEMYNLVKAMRLHGPAAHAAVDTMGCERLARADASPRDRRFHTLVALMLSSQTKDTVNAEAMARLHRELPPYREGAPPGLNLDNMLAVDPVLLNELIGKVGFHNNKTKYLKETASILRDNFASDIPPTIESLCSLPGVGPKMAHLCMSAEHGWNRVEGIGVDVHVHRITNLWGWNGPSVTKTPEETRRALESWLPREKWKEINWLLVGFGQTVCLPVGRKCGDCELGLRGLCRAAERGKVSEGRRRRERAAAAAVGVGGVKVEVKDEEAKVEVKDEEGEGRGKGRVTVKKEEVEDEGAVVRKVKGEGKGEGKVEVGDEEAKVEMKDEEVGGKGRVKVKKEEVEEAGVAVRKVKGRVVEEAMVNGLVLGLSEGSVRV